MSTIKALVIGVSDYSQLKENNLPFCINDISTFSKALINGLNTEPSNIITCGNSGIVTKRDFINTLKMEISNVKIDDTFIFYFSGHGGNSKDRHFLLLSDGYVKTQDKGE